MVLLYMLPLSGRNIMKKKKYEVTSYCIVEKMYIIETSDIDLSLEDIIYGYTKSVVDQELYEEIDEVKEIKYV